MKMIFHFGGPEFVQRAAEVAAGGDEVGAEAHLRDEADTAAREAEAEVGTAAARPGEASAAVGAGVQDEVAVCLEAQARGTAGLVVGAREKAVLRPDPSVDHAVADAACRVVSLEAAAVVLTEWTGAGAVV